MTSTHLTEPTACFVHHHVFSPYRRAGVESDIYAMLSVELGVWKVESAVHHLHVV